ncbi:MAG: NfeD family protein [Bacteroides sp.]|jgi:membrane-bound serine protease (ClpP class)|nr:NfeD family protein [Bacteroides sp.]
MKTFRIVFAGILLVLIGFQVAAQRVDRVGEMLANDPGKTFKIYKYDVKEDIARPAVYKTQKAFEEADSLGADLVLIHMNTYGGAVDAADSIRTRILQSKIPVIVFIDNNAASAGALISIACDQIYMRTGANMGAATVVDATGQVVPDKFQSYMRSTMRSTAEAKGRDPEIAQAMVDPSFEIPGLVDEGKVLTFTASEAIEWGYCEGIAENVDEVMQVAGIENYEFIEQQFTWIEKLIGFLISPVVSGLLIMLIIGGIYFELQTPGIGFPILAAAVAALLYFAPLYIEGLASHWEIAFFIIGVVLIAVELFAIPGFGVTGVLGLILVLTGLAMAMVGNDGWDFTGVPAREVLVAFLIVIIALFFSLTASFYLGQKLFTPGKRFKGFALNTIQETESGYTSASAQMKSLLGKTGTAFTVLRPSGKVEVEDDIYDATALTGYIEKGEAIKVVKYETSQVFVVKV